MTYGQFYEYGKQKLMAAGIDEAAFGCTTFCWNISAIQTGMN